MGQNGGVAPIQELAASIRIAYREKRQVHLDTSAIIAYLQRDNPFFRIVTPLLEHPAISVGISTMTLAETLAGPAMINDHETMRRIRDGLVRLPRFVITPFDSDIAFETAIVRSETSLKLPDAAIIAAARHANAVVIIGNDRRWKSKSLGIRYFHLGDLAE